MKWYKKLVLAVGGALGLAFVVTTAADLMVSQYNPTAVVVQQTQTTTQVQFVNVAVAAQDQAQISSICQVQGGAYSMNFHVTVQSQQNLVGSTGVLTLTSSTGVQSVVNLTFDDKGGGSYNGVVVLAAGQYTVTAGTVAIGPGLTQISVHNVPFPFSVPQGTPNCATAVGVSKFEAKTGSALEDHTTVMYSIDFSNPLYITALAFVIVAGIVLYGVWLLGSHPR